MDTAIIVGVIIGSILGIALVFGKTVLGVAWTGNGAKKAYWLGKRKEERNCATAHSGEE